MTNSNEYSNNEIVAHMESVVEFLKQCNDLTPMEKSSLAKNVEFLQKAKK